MKTRLFWPFRLARLLSAASVLVLLACVGLRADDTLPVHQKYDNLSTAPYEGEAIFTCNQNDYKIPTYLPYIKNQAAVYISTSENHCSPRFLEIFFSTSPDCDGSAPCKIGSFSEIQIEYTPQDYLLQKRCELLYEKFNLTIQ